jgi:hypothetical protein
MLVFSVFSVWAQRKKNNFSITAYFLLSSGRSLSGSVPDLLEGTCHLEAFSQHVVMYGMFLAWD